jgi:hypothetical protein
VYIAGTALVLWRNLFSPPKRSRVMSLEDRRCGGFKVDVRYVDILSRVDAFSTRFPRFPV